MALLISQITIYSEFKQGQTYLNKGLNNTKQYIPPFNKNRTIFLWLFSYSTPTTVYLPKMLIQANEVALFSNLPRIASPVSGVLCGE